MRDNSGFPGMKILQFAFEGTNSYYLPHNYIANTVAYVGTHDNETARGWFEGTATPRQREQAALYTHQQAGEPMADALNRTIAASVSDTCIYTMQDLLNLGNEARINTPATLGGNWTGACSTAPSPASSSTNSPTGPRPTSASRRKPKSSFLNRSYRARPLPTVRTRLLFPREATPIPSRGLLMNCRHETTHHRRKHAPN